MRVLCSVFGRQKTLKRALLLNILAASCLCIVMAAGILLHEFDEHLREDIHRDLDAEATELLSQIDLEQPHYGLDPQALRFQGTQGRYRYTVFDGAGQAIVGSEASDEIWQQLKAISVGHAEDIYLPDGRIGVGLRDQLEQGGSPADLFILVSNLTADSAQAQLAFLLHEVQEEIWWVILGAVIVVVAAVLAANRALAPLETLSGQADKISPTASGERLNVEQVPIEIAPLIVQVNKAFDRLEQGYQAQRDFASNVAHEIRTPIAVLRSTIDRIAEPSLQQNLGQDLAQIDRIFGQLIDLSRADAAARSGFETLDLRRLATETAADMVQFALRSGRSLSVIGADQVHVQGNAGLLDIALRNVVRNAVQYAPEGTEIQIELMSNPVGWRVLDRGPGKPDALKPDLFERFNRGAQVNSKTEGSGIGLAIVKSVAQSHGATASITDRDGGGSVLSFVFNAPEADKSGS